MRQHHRATQSITASYDETGTVVFDHKEVSEQVVSKWSTVFKGQKEPVFSHSKTPYPPDIPDDSPILNHLPKSNHTKHEKFLCRPYTLVSLKKILGGLKDNKSRGIDNIPAEVLKNADGKLLDYLLEFYNVIWKSGDVPESLNVIKCVLIHKSGDSLGKYCRRASYK